MISEYRLSIDFSKINNVIDFHDEMKEIFGFPDFYGKNIHALIDCLSSLRFPEDAMTKIHINMDEVLIIEVINITFSKVDVIKDFIIAIESVNQRSVVKGRLAPLLVKFVEK